jgi:hypothetical protein
MAVSGKSPCRSAEIWIPARSCRLAPSARATRPRAVVSCCARACLDFPIAAVGDGQMRDWLLGVRIRTLRHHLFAACARLRRGTRRNSLTELPYFKPSVTHVRDESAASARQISFDAARAARRETVCDKHVRRYALRLRVNISTQALRATTT